MEALDAILDSISDLIEGITVTEVSGCSQSVSGSYRGSKYTFYPPALKIEIVTNAVDAAEIVRLIQSRSDGQICVQDVTDALRIRNGQCGVAGL